MKGPYRLTLGRRTKVFLGGNGLECFVPGSTVHVPNSWL